MPRLTACSLLVLLVSWPSAAPLTAQSAPRALPAFGPSPGNHAAEAARPPFVPSGYAYAFLNPTTTPPSYLVFLAGTRTFSDGRVAEEINQSPDFGSGGTTLVNQFRSTYAYDGARLSQHARYVWDASASAWVPEARESYAYDASGRATGMTEERYEMGAWQNASRTTTTFDAAGLPAQILHETWSSGAWVPQERDVISEDGAAVVFVDQTWSGTAWVNTRRMLHPTPLADLFAAQQLFEATVLSTALFLFVPPNRETAGLFYALPYTAETWDATTSAWVNEERVRVVVDTGAQLQSVGEEWDAGTGAWRITERTTLTLAANRVQEVLIESTDGTTPLAVETRLAYTYDGDGNATLVEFFSDDDQDGTLETPAGSRLALTYTDLATGTEGADDDASPARLTGVQPLPSNGATRVAFTAAQAGHVSVAVFDALGREVARLTDRVWTSGAHTLTFDASTLPSGVYVVRLESYALQSTLPLVVVR